MKTLRQTCHCRTSQDLDKSAVPITPKCWSVKLPVYSWPGLSIWCKRREEFKIRRWVQLFRKEEPWSEFNLCWWYSFCVYPTGVSSAAVVYFKHLHFSSQDEANVLNYSYSREERIQLKHKYESWKCLCLIFRAITKHLLNYILKNYPVFHSGFYPLVYYFLS